MENLVKKAGGVILFFIVIISIKFACLILQIDLDDVAKRFILFAACGCTIAYYMITYLDRN